MHNKLIVSVSPHVKDTASTSSIMLAVVAALTPAAFASVLIFGYRSAVMIVTCILASVLFEYIYRVLLKKRNTIGDCSAIVTGMLLAFNLPVTCPLWMAVLGCFVAIVAVKQLFGGIGRNFANPAIVARIVLLISFSSHMSTWLLPQPTGNGLGIDLVSGATPLSHGGVAPNTLLMLLGVRGGSLGETCIVALLVGGLYLIIRKVITPTIPLCFLGTVVALSLLFGQDPVLQLLSGGVVLGAFFMATDYTTSPTTESGKAIFAVGCGLLTMVIRTFGSYPEGVSFAILFMNILTPHIERWTMTKPFGTQMQRGAVK